MNGISRVARVWRGLLLLRLRAALRAGAAPKWHPDAQAQPGEAE